MSLLGIRINKSTVQTNAAKNDRLVLLTNVEYDYTDTTLMLEAELMQQTKHSIAKVQPDCPCTMRGSVTDVLDLYPTHDLLS